MLLIGRKTSRNPKSQSVRFMNVYKPSPDGKHLKSLQFHKPTDWITRRTGWQKTTMHRMGSNVQDSDPNEDQPVIPNNAAQIPVRNAFR